MDIGPLSEITGAFNGVQQIVRITRLNKDHKSYKSNEHTVYAICSRSSKKLNASELAQAIRKHWSIEIRLHGQRDVRMREDANKTHVGAAPRALACLRNWAVAIAEKFQRSNAMRRISKAWQALRYNQAKAIGTVLT
jgi:predicted transposase YbfD/YdcC